MDRQHLLLRDDETGFTVRGQTFKPFALSDQLYFRDLWLVRHKHTVFCQLYVPLGARERVPLPYHCRY